MSEKTNKFGGQWTVEKLEILKEYLNAYTLVFKNKPRIKLLYIDAFAGSGEIRLDQEDINEFIAGSATIALQVDDRSFDSLIFIEQDRERYENLLRLCSKHPDRNIKIYNTDANEFLQEKLRNINSGNRRGVLFLDPFATQVEWATIEKIAKCEILDTWILFPTSAIARMMPLNQSPKDIDKKWADRLNIIYGDDSWNDVYDNVAQKNLFDDHQNRDRGVEQLIKVYKDKLASLLGRRLLDESATFYNSKNSPFFEFIFFTGSPSSAAIKASHRIAKHLIPRTKKND